MMEQKPIPPCCVLAEFLGAFLFAFFGGGCDANSVSTGLPTAALGNGLLFAVLVYATAGISGGHLNPAISAAFFATGRYFLIQSVAAHLLAQGCGERRGVCRDTCLHKTRHRVRQRVGTMYGQVKRKCPVVVAAGNAVEWIYCCRLGKQRFLLYVAAQFAGACCGAALLRLSLPPSYLDTPFITAGSLTAAHPVQVRLHASIYSTLHRAHDVSDAYSVDGTSSLTRSLLLSLTIERWDRSTCIVTNSFITTYMDVSDGCRFSSLSSLAPLYSCTPSSPLLSTRPVLPR